MSKDFWLVLAGIICAALYSGGMIYLGYEEGHKGVAVVQAAWDAQTKLSTDVATKAKAVNVAKTAALGATFTGINATYLGLTNAQTPSISAAIPASLSAGTIGLRDTSSCPSRSAGATATAASRAADAAATQALADRTANAIAVIRLGDAADARERQLDAQIVALQAVITAERAAYNTKYNTGTTPNGGH